MKNPLKILGIETSCDETAIAVIEATGSLEQPVFTLLGSAINSQIEIHKEYGGVFPMLAKREHIKNLPLVLEKALKEAGVKMTNIDNIAVTVGPGLEPALWTGITFAKELSEKYAIPLIPTNHMEGHLASVLLSPQQKQVKFPALGLLISGGHTEIVLMNNWSDKKILGQTKDDAVGEAFDKVARMLGLPYPGGPEISKLAKEARGKGISLEVNFPRPMIHFPNYDFSFSGLKTAVLYYLRDLKNKAVEIDASKKIAIAREFEEATTEVLMAKIKKAIEEFDPKTLIIGGGVISNSYIRSNFTALIQEINKEKAEDLALLIPDKTLTTDNGVMIALAGYLTLLSDKTLELKAQGNLQIN